MLKKTSQEDFKNDISNGVVLVDFYADWCGPCQQLAPELERLNELDSSANIIKVNIDEANEVASEYGVMSIPTMILFKNGNQVDQKVGVSKAEELQEWIKKA
ncbi:MAG: thioredoxin [Mycoplasmatales bacterium]